MERELENDRSVWDLFQAIVHLKDLQECACFFRDLCTLTELKAMAERWEVAQMVAQDVPYRKISELTGASTATITRVAHWVNYGEGGYRLMLERAGAHRAKEQGSKRTKKQKRKRAKEQ